MPPERIGSLRIGTLVGAGGFASVYRASESDGEVAVAIKLAHDAAPSTIERFRREAEALALIGPPFVPLLLESGRADDGRPYLVMELVDGETLAERLARETTTSLRERCELALRILESLAAIRARDLVHRDLKPENIVVPRRGPARLIDFGLVRDAGGDSTLTHAGAVLGTSDYMAPEQLRGDAASPATDVYAFGVILYELLAGRRPFVGDRASVEHGHLHLRPACPSLYRPVPGTLETVVLACLAKEPGLRPDELASIRDELERAASTDEPIAATRSPGTAIKMDGASPVVLVYVAGDVPAAALRDLVATSRARVGRQRSGEIVLAFLGTEHTDPLDAALDLARDATTRWDCRSAVHVGRALVRRSGGRVALFGRDVDRFESWVPAAPWRGVVLTSTASEMLDADRPGDPVLVGRDGELSVVRTAVANALHGARPCCCLIVGEDGAGKSALARSIRASAGVETFAISCRRDGDELALPQLLGFLDIESASAAVTRLRARTMHAPLVIIVDDAHFADDLTLEILDRACELEDCALAIVVTCGPRFAAANRSWTRRNNTLVTELGPLDEGSTMALARRLLPPQTRVSADVLQRLARWSGGNAGVLTQLIDVLRRERIVRRHEGTSSWFVAADELDRLPASPAAEWLATRELDTLSPELADCARICAILGAELSLDEVEAVQRAIESRGHDRLVDAAIGLAMLVRHGVLVDAGAARFSFRRRVVQEALYALVPDDARVAIHRAAFEHLRSRGDGELERLAHHGSRGGYASEARGYYATLADRATARHEYRDAERMLTAAIEACASDQASVLYDHLEDRGSVRRLLTHYEGAREDFRRARQLAEQLGDRVKIVSVLVAEAAVCDFTQEWDAQTRLMQTAQELARDGLPPRIEARFRNWLGVTRARQGASDDAVELLSDAMTLGAAIGDHETQVGSGLLLGYLLVVNGQRERGLAVLEDTMARCERAGDWFHFVMGLNNRIILSKLDDSQDQAESDCQRAIEISHEHGFHQLEIWGLLNLSITRWWRGRCSDALDLARRAYDLSLERFGSKSSHRERLHYAMHLVADGRGLEARDLLRGVREQEFESSPIDCANLRAIRLALDGGSEREWRDVIERTRDVGDDWDFVEVLWLRARASSRSGDHDVARAASREAYEQALRLRAPLAATMLIEHRPIAA